jgi:hypothetical protein
MDSALSPLISLRSATGAKVVMHLGLPKLMNKGHDDAVDQIVPTVVNFPKGGNLLAVS